MYYQDNQFNIYCLLYLYKVQMDKILNIHYYENNLWMNKKYINWYLLLYKMSMKHHNHNKNYILNNSNRDKYFEDIFLNIYYLNRHNMQLDNLIHILIHPLIILQMLDMIEHMFLLYHPYINCSHNQYYIWDTANSILFYTNNIRHTLCHNNQCILMNILNIIFNLHKFLLDI